MKIDISLLEKAIKNLDEVMQLEKNAIIRDSAIQRFALEESDLPYKIDLVNYDEIDPEILLKAIKI